MFIDKNGIMWKSRWRMRREGKKIWVEITVVESSLGGKATDEGLHFLRFSNHAKTRAETIPPIEGMRSKRGKKNGLPAYAK